MFPLLDICKVVTALPIKMQLLLGDDCLPDNYGKIKNKKKIKNLN